MAELWNDEQVSKLLARQSFYSRRYNPSDSELEYMLQDLRNDLLDEIDKRDRTIAEQAERIAGLMTSRGQYAQDAAAWEIEALAAKKRIAELEQLDEDRLAQILGKNEIIESCRNDYESRIAELEAEAAINAAYVKDLEAECDRCATRIAELEKRSSADQ